MASKRAVSKHPTVRRGGNVHQWSADLGEWVPALDGWTLELVCRQDGDGRWVLAEATMRPTAVSGVPSGGIGVAEWRAVPIGRIAADAVKATASEAAGIEAAVHRERDRLIAAWAKRRGPSGHPDYLYALLAADYLAQWRSGDRTATESVAKWYQMPRATAARRLREARLRGLLVSSGQGKAGGELSKRAAELIASPEARDLLEGED